MIERGSRLPVLVGVALLAATLATFWACVLLDASTGFAILLPALPAAATAWWVAAKLEHADAEARRRTTEAVDQLRSLAGFGAGQESTARPADVLERSVDRLSGSLQRFEQELEVCRATLDASDAAIIATGPRGEVVLMNSEAARLFGDRPVSPIGRLVDELFTQHEIIGLHAAAAGSGTRSVQRAQVRLPVKGEMRTFQVLAAPIGESVGSAGGPQRAGVALILRDISEFASAIQNRTDFVANASHEFRTPLSSIRAAVETLVDCAKDDPVMAERLVSMIAANVTRLEELTRDMLDLSRLESPDAPVEIGPVRMSELAESLRAHFDQQCAERKLSLAIECDAALDRMETDARLLQLILRNLIDNATKFAYEGTTVRVVGRRVSPEEGGPNTKRHAARFVVSDQGMGIPLAAQRRIFERFYQVDASRSGQNTRRGTGLGLAIVKSSVKALGGTISVESVWKQGTTMTIELPACVSVEDEPAASV
jgi:PAS domain S-box-containing protein